MKKTIAVLSGDGIGPEIMAEAIKLLSKIEQLFGHAFILQQRVNRWSCLGSIWTTLSGGNEKNL